MGITEEHLTGSILVALAARSTALETRCLGKQTLYQLSYSRVGGEDSADLLEKPSFRPELPSADRGRALRQPLGRRCASARADDKYCDVLASLRRGDAECRFVSPCNLPAG